MQYKGAITRMTIDVLRVTTKISGKTGRKPGTKRRGRPNSLRLRRNSGERFGTQTICAASTPLCYYSAAMRFGAQSVKGKLFCLNSGPRNRRKG